MLMSIDTAVVLLITIAVIVLVAWVLVYIAGQAGAPPPVGMIIWCIAGLLVLLVLLRSVGIVHGEEAGFPRAAVAFPPHLRFHFPNLMLACGQTPTGAPHT